MADGDKIITLPEDDEAVVPRTQDQRGGTGRSTNAKKLENDVEKALKAANATGNVVTETGAEPPPGDVDPVEDGQETVAELRARLKQETKRRESLEREVDEAKERTGQVLDAKAQSDLNTLKTAKAHLSEQLDTLKQSLATAHAEGDFNAIADISQKMMQGGIQLSSIDNGIIALENAPKQREALRRRGEPDDAKYAQITKGMDPAAKQWFRDNPEYYKDDRKLQRVIAAHNMVMTGDDPPEENTPEYFTAVEQELRDPKFNHNRRTENSGAGDDDDEPLSEASGGARRRADVPPAGAPVTRNGRGAGGADRNVGRQVRLTKEEQETAEMNGLTHEEYALNKRKLEREGRLGPNASNRNRMH